MKKRIAIIVLIVAALSTVSIVTAVAADAPTGLVQAVRGAIGRGGWGPLQGVAEFLGLTPQQMQQARADGKTVADLAVEQGKDLGQLVDSVINTRPPSMAEQIAEAVANGSITQEQADQQLADMQERLTNMLFGQLSGDRPEGRGGWVGGRGGMKAPGAGYAHDALSEALGMTVEQVRTALADGTTVAELIAQQGLEIDAVVDALFAPEAERLAQAVTDGKITQEQSDALTALHKANLVERLNGTGQGPMGAGELARPQGMTGGRGGRR